MDHDWLENAVNISKSKPYAWDWVLVAVGRWVKGAKPRLTWNRSFKNSIAGMLKTKSRIESSYNPNLDASTLPLTSKEYDEGNETRNRLY
jgi:hypothetical protein